MQEDIHLNFSSSSWIFSLSIQKFGIKNELRILILITLYTSRDILRGIF